MRTALLLSVGAARKLGMTLVLAVIAQAKPAAAISPPARELIIESVGVYDHDVWFADELAPIADAVAETLAEPRFGGYRAVPLAELRDLWTGVQRGRLPGLTTTCAAAPPPILLAELLHPKALWTRPEIRCAKGSCTLELIVWERKPSKKGERNDRQVAVWRAALPSRENPVQWAQRIRRDGLRRGKLDDGYGGLIGNLQGDDDQPVGIRVTLSDINRSGDWSYPLDGDFLQPVAARLHACAQGGHTWRDWWAQPFLVEVDDHGRLVRCESPYPDHLPPPERGCQCGVLAKMDYRPGGARRRASFELVTTAPREAAVADRYVRNAYLADKQSNDPSAILGTGEVDTKALIHCLEPVRRDLGRRTVPVRFQAGSDGKATSVQATWPSSFPSDVATCLDSVLRQAWFNCPLSGRAEVNAQLMLEFIVR